VGPFGSSSVQDTVGILLLACVGTLVGPSLKDPVDALVSEGIMLARLMRSNVGLSVVPARDDTMLGKFVGT